tara:strand:+ start:232 stop:429 length:198 start_codon:yes stop_codon:yes gene_type:complete
MTTPTNQMPRIPGSLDNSVGDQPLIFDRKLTDSQLRLVEDIFSKKVILQEKVNDAWHVVLAGRQN